ncbi:atp synthase subunit alpha [Fusarium longipes]|uniref:Atp synthase subunit alpha n=1 Tax=Fusarium longipes TaxID=694270 RepID=A0A395RQW7_9HYPO|nr:atp synthase subunit alpha [Fusarium longipes]
MGLRRVRTIWWSKRRFLSWWHFKDEIAEIVGLMIECIPEIIEYLAYGIPPNRTEAHFCSPSDSKTLVETDRKAIIIITEPPNPALIGGKRPIEVFFEKWIRNAMLDITISVVRIEAHTGSRMNKTWAELRKTLLHDEPAKDKWNYLDVSSLLPVSTPYMFTGPKTQLLANICKISNEKALLRRSLRGTLLSCGGCHTPSHIDPARLGTYLTVHKGYFGFGFIATENSNDIQSWLSDPASVKHLAQYVVLRPGQTVFFPSRTIDFVFRLNDHQTFATSGSILLWHGIMDWLQILKRQELNKTLFSDITPALTKNYVKAMETIIDACIKHNDLEYVGGLEVAKTIQYTVKNWKFFKPDDEDVVMSG